MNDDKPIKKYFKSYNWNQKTNDSFMYANLEDEFFLLERRIDRLEAKIDTLLGDS